MNQNQIRRTQQSFQFLRKKEKLQLTIQGDWEREIGELRRVGEEALIKSTEEAMALPRPPPFSVLFKTFFLEILAINPPILATVKATPIRDLALGREAFWLVICGLGKTEDWDFWIFEEEEEDGEEEELEGVNL